MSTVHWQARRLPIPAAWPVRSSPAAHPWAIISAGLAPVLLTGAYLMAGILQPASYSPVRTTISVMAGQAAVTIAVWPAFAARRASPRPLILSVYGSAAVTAVFVALLGWLLAETRDGSVLGLAERLTSSIQTCWPFIVAVALRRTRRPRPGG
jgi:hypothetical protein